MSSNYTKAAMRYVHRGLTADLGPQIADEVMRQLGPVFDQLLHLDNQIAINEKLLKAAKKQRRKQKAVNKRAAASIGRIKNGVAGLTANGHVHSLSEAWSWTPGRQPKVPNWHPERSV